MGKRNKSHKHSHELKMILIDEYQSDNVVFCLCILTIKEIYFIIMSRATGQEKYKICFFLWEKMESCFDNIN